MKRLKLIVLLLLPLICVAENCENANTTLAMNQCYSAQLDQANAQLNQNYQQLKKLLDAKQTAALVQAEKNWLTYRKQYCDFMAMRYEGGSIQPIITGRCITDITQQQAKNLHTAIENYKPN